LQPGRCRRPIRILLQCCGNLTLDLHDLHTQGGDQLLHALSHCRDDERPLQQSVQLIADLLPQIEQRITLSQALLQLVLAGTALGTFRK
jgi:hypothetical protein